jgi:hypothetical protein
VDEEGVVFIQDQARVLGLNETGMRVLERIDGATPVGTLLEALARELDVPRERLEADVLPFLDDLLARGALEEPGRPAEGAT